MLNDPFLFLWRNKLWVYVLILISENVVVFNYTQMNEVFQKNFCNVILDRIYFAL